MKFKTLKHYNLPGHAHELTFSCFQKQPFFADETACSWFIEALEQVRIKMNFDLWAYVVMPEHVHLLIYPNNESYQISRVLWGLKLPVSLRAVSHYRSTDANVLGRMEELQPNGKILHRFWQRGGGYDRNMTTPEIIQASIDYIHDNPVRRRLVACAVDWRWSSAGFYAGIGNYPVEMDYQSIPLL